jgi:hypothetical protein
MEMIVMSPPGAHLAKPGPVAAGFELAQCLLDGRVDEDPGNARLSMRRAGSAVHGCRSISSDRPAVGAFHVKPAFQHGDRRNLFPLFGRQPPLRHFGQPDIRIETDLVAGMSGQSSVRRAAGRGRRPEVRSSRGPARRLQDP